MFLFLVKRSFTAPPDTKCDSSASFCPISSVILFHFKGHLLLSLSVFPVTLLNNVPMGQHAFLDSIQYYESV